MSILKFVRPRRWQDKVRSYRVFVDDLEIGTLKEQEELLVPVTPGSHYVHLKIDWCSSPQTHVYVPEGSTRTLSCEPTGPPIIGVFRGFLQSQKYLLVKEQEVQSDGPSRLVSDLTAAADKSTSRGASSLKTTTHRQAIMQGRILDFSVQSNSGMISTEGGERFTFSGAEWKEPKPPIRGEWVDFEYQGAVATGVYRALSTAGRSQSSSAKSKAAVTLWAIFLGGFGAHKFYMGSWGWGIVYLLTCWLYIPFVVALVEWIRLILLTDEEFGVRADAFKNSGPFAFFW